MTTRMLRKLGKPSKHIYTITPKHSLYRGFKRLKANRILNQNNLNQLRKSVLEDNLLEMCPIIVSLVNDVFYIVDGQHRNKIAIEENLTFYVYFYDGVTTPEIIARLNTNQKNWTISDFARSFSEINGTKQVYSKYCDYYEDNNITHQMLISLYNGKSHKGVGVKEFKKGELRWNPLIRSYVEDKLHELKRLEYAAFNPALRKVTLRKQSFQTAILNALNTPNFEYDKFLENLYSTKHFFNKFHKIVDMEKEIFRIERVK